MVCPIRKSLFLSAFTGGGYSVGGWLFNFYPNSKKLSLSKIIFFTPEFISTEDLPFFFRAADTFVLPYLNIDHSGALHLAYSFSIPVIATTVGDFPESIQEGKSGFLIPPKNEHALSNAMLTASLHRGKMAKMGKYAHQLSKTIYPWDNIAILTRKAYGISK